MNIKKYNFIFLNVVIFLLITTLSFKIQAKENNIEEVIKNSEDINEFISLYGREESDLEPTIIVIGVNATKVARSKSVIGSKYIGDHNLVRATKFFSEYRTNGAYLDSYLNNGDLVVTNYNGEIEYIHLESASKKDLVNLNNFSKLSGVSFRSSDMEIMDLRGLTSIKELSIFKSNINKLVLPSKNIIEVINISLSPILEIENLSNLNKLESIDIQSSKIKDLSGLNNSNRLRRLYFNSNGKGNITEFPNLSLLPSLEYLHFFSREVNEVKGIDKLSKLKFLFTGDNFNYQGIDFPKSLEYLNTGGKENEHFPKINGNINLKEVIVKNTKIKTINNLEELINLRVLKLPLNEINKIDGIGDLNDLEVLDLYGNKISKIEGLNKLHKLVELDLGDNEISKIEELDSLINIKYIKLNENKITKVEGLKNLSGVKGISFEHNPIETLDFSEIEHLKNTKVLMWYTPFWKTATKEDKRKLDNLARKGHL